MKDVMGMMKKVGEMQAKLKQVQEELERAEYEGYGYNQWFAEHMFLFAPAGAFVGQWLQSFKEFPPRQKPGSFNLDRVMEAVMSNAGKQ